MKVAFVTNICPHYRIKTFEALARYYHDLDFYFFSAGKEWYWQQQHGVKSGKFHHQYLKGFEIGGTRITLSLPFKLWRGDYDVYIKCITGRFALPVTYLIARLKHRPFILWTGIWMRLQTRAHRLLFPLTRYIYHHADAIVVYGEHVKQYLITEGVSPEKIFIAYHAVDNDVYNREVSEAEKTALLQILQIEPEQKMLLYLGRLEEVKGLPYLLDAFAILQHCNTVLVLAGTGSEQQHLERLAKEKGIDHRVRFTGYVPPQETSPYYATAWVYVLPSITVPAGRELWGLVVNEAFNQGLPVVASEAVGAAAGGFVKDGVNGFVVPERDSVALANAIDCILADPGLRTRFSQNARLLVETWDNERMVLGFRQAIDYVGGKR